ncbi:MAG TPA: protein kinase [Blastocatellia bacterium]|nr:protein kinase [Blastocatellia bacterium]
MNSPERMQQMQQLFHETLERPPQERRAYLAQHCAGDAELQREIEALLNAHEESEGFLSKPANGQPEFDQEASTLIQSAPPTQTVSHYEIISLLGKGGMGEVYLASDQLLGRKAALKILPARYTTNADLVHRFEREAKAASALNHPNILTVYEIGKTADSHFIATEFIAGENLRQRLKRAPLLLTEALDIALQTAAALNAAHEAGIIHRDIKPENIMLRPDGYVKVLDFGLAKLTEGPRNPDESTTQTGMIMGTPSYMSPEQARGQKVDARSDIWSFGVVLYELVCGARPFGDNTQADLLVSILEREPTPLPHHLPEGLRAIINRTLAKEPQQRYARTQELLEDLKAVRRKVEFESELKLAAQSEPAEATTIRQSEEVATLKLTPEKETKIEATAPPDVATPAPPRFPTRAITAGIALIGALGIGSWYIFKPQPAPPPPVAPPAAKSKHELTWWLTVQRMFGGKLEGKPFASNGSHILTPGSKFKFNLTSPHNGYLYLLNQGPTTGDKISLNLLYPTAANNNLNAAVTAQQPIQTSNYELDPNTGDEQFWIVWATNPIKEVEAVKTKTVRAEIQDAAASAAILQLLQQHATKSSVTTDEAQERTKVSGDDIIVQLVKLKHY